MIIFCNYNRLDEEEKRDNLKQEEKSGNEDPDILESVAVQEQKDSEESEESRDEKGRLWLYIGGIILACIIIIAINTNCHVTTTTLV